MMRVPGFVEIPPLLEHIHRRVVEHGEEAEQGVEPVGRLDVGDRALPMSIQLRSARSSFNAGSRVPSRWMCSSALGRPVTNSRVGVAGSAISSPHLDADVTLDTASGDLRLSGRNRSARPRLAHFMRPSSEKLSSSALWLER